MTNSRTQSGHDAGLARSRYILNTDGGIVAAANQPEGEAAMGVLITSEDGHEVARASARLGWQQDHHVAEFNALVFGLTLVRQLGIDNLEIRTDSELVHRTVKGEWKLRPDHLRKLRDQAVELWELAGRPTIDWVPRKQNSLADGLAGEVLGPLRPKPSTLAHIIERESPG
ncbi:MAG: ribonuclease HI family protein [Actinomycetota bacterium]|nr:ribonuclease HI family protein [Actinomycetota bacterium]